MTGTNWNAMTPKITGPMNSQPVNVRRRPGFVVGASSGGACVRGVMGPSAGTGSGRVGIALAVLSPL